MTARDRLFLIAAIVLLGAVCFKFLIYDPHQASHAVLVQARDAAAAELAREQQVLARAEKVRAEYARLQAFIATVEAKLPTAKEVPALLTTMERFTRRLGIKLNSFVPGALTAVTDTQAARGAPAPGSPAATEAGAKTVPYSQMPVSLSITGTFAQVKQYLHDLRDLPRLIIVDSVSLTPQTLPRLGIGLSAEIYTIGTPGNVPVTMGSGPAATPSSAPAGAPAVAPASPPANTPTTTPPRRPGVPNIPTSGGH